MYKEALDTHFKFCEHIRVQLRLPVKDHLCVYLKACFSKVLSEVCSHDCLQEPSQGDDVAMTSCPEGDQKAQYCIQAYYMLQICNTCLVLIERTLQLPP